MQGQCSREVQTHVSSQTPASADQSYPLQYAPVNMSTLSYPMDYSGTVASAPPQTAEHVTEASAPAYAEATAEHSVVFVSDVVVKN